MSRVGFRVLCFVQMFYQHGHGLSAFPDTLMTVVKRTEMTRTNARRSSTMATVRNGDRTVLMVIDVQNDVVANALDRDGVVGRIATLVARARTEDVPVVFVQHHDAEMPQGSDGWQIVDGLVPGDSEPVITKEYPDAFADTALPQVLADLGATHLVVAGAQSMACIRATSHRALAEGYDLTLVSDAHTTDDLDWDGVFLSARQIIDYTNLYLQFTTYPGQETRVVPHDAVAF